MPATYTAGWQDGKLSCRLSSALLGDRVSHALLVVLLLAGASATLIWTRDLSDLLGEGLDSEPGTQTVFDEDDGHGGGGESCPADVSREELIELIRSENPFQPECEVACDALAQCVADDPSQHGDPEDNGEEGAGSGSDSEPSSSTSSSSSSSSSSAASPGPSTPAASFKRGSGLGPNNVWEEVLCKYCGAESFAQLEDFSGYGRVEMFICWVRLRDGSLPGKGPFHKRRMWTKDGSKVKCERWCLRWLRKYRQCCK